MKVPPRKLQSNHPWDFDVSFGPRFKPAPPKGFSDAMRAAWAYAVNHAPPGKLTQHNVGALVIWVGAEDWYRRSMKAQAEIDGESPRPFLARSKSGGVITAPYLGIIQQAADLMLKASEKLGFTPSVRP